MKSTGLRIALAMVALCTTAASAIADASADGNEFVTTRISVTGAVEHPLDLTVADLARLPSHRIHEVPLICQSGAGRDKLENIRGVRLRDLLESAVVVASGHNDVKKMAIIATASDGYKVVFSWSELFNSPVGDGVVVFFERNGMPLPDDEGRIALVSTADIRTGPRHVKWLRNVEVRKIVD
ncbi:MAG: molybdopterin-dependent oxidoreductase [Steroidobacteraceae bacterium]